MILSRNVTSPKPSCAELALPARCGSQTKAVHIISALRIPKTGKMSRTKLNSPFPEFPSKTASPMVSVEEDSQRKYSATPSIPAVGPNVRMVLRYGKLDTHLTLLRNATGKIPIA